MGTMRGFAGSRSSGSRTFSDPDCTSGSEVSCNTVIYMGRRAGPTFSDGDATDVDRPPSVLSRRIAHTSSMMMRQQSENARGVIGARQETIGGSQQPMSPRHYQLAATSGDGAPSPVHGSSRKTGGGAHHKSGSSRSPLISRHRFDQLHGMQELWVDGPVVQQHAADAEPRWPREHELPLSPAVLAPVAQQQTYGHLRHMKEKSAAAGGKYPAGQQTEMWIDGPKEFCVANASNLSQQHSHSGDGRLAPFGAKQQRQQPSSDKPSAVVPTDTKSPQHLQQAADVDMSPRRGTPVKSFVKDWVTKHSNLTQIDEQPTAMQTDYVDAVPLPPTSSSRSNTPKYAAAVRPQPASPAVLKAKVAPVPPVRDLSSLGTSTVVSSVVKRDDEVVVKTTSRLLLVPGETEDVLVASTESVYEREVEHCLADVSVATTFTSDDDGTLGRVELSKRPTEPCAGDERRDIHIYEELDFDCKRTETVVEQQCVVEHGTPSRSILRPSCLRRPDGASNPNLVSCQSVTTDTSQQHLAVTINSASTNVVSKQTTAVIPTQQQQTTTNSVSSIPVASVTSTRSPAKSCGLFAKVLSRKSSSPSKSAEKQSSSNQQQATPTKVPMLSFLPSPKNSPSKSDSNNKSSKEKESSSKNGSGKRSGLKSPVSFSETPATMTVGSAHTSTPTSSSLRGQWSTPSSSRLPTAIDISHDSQRSPAKYSFSSGRDSKADSRGKERSKSSGSRSKERKSGRSTSEGRESDSGNDSGIMEIRCSSSRLQSPYSKVTKPRLSQHSASSGRGSDNSSTFSGQAVCTEEGDQHRRVAGGSSSGCESMLHDGDVTGSNSSSNESAANKHARGCNFYKKKSSSGELFF
jgi:hypothetical protein